MDNIELIGKQNIQILEGYYDLSDEDTVMKGDKVAMISITNLQKKEFQISWIDPDNDSFGKPKRFAGKIVVRNNKYLQIINVEAHSG